MSPYITNNRRKLDLIAIDEYQDKQNLIADVRLLILETKGGIIFLDYVAIFYQFPAYMPHLKLN